MSIRTPTSDADPAGAGAPLQFPDAALLAQWANELFKALPVGAAGYTGAPGLPATGAASGASPLAAIPAVSSPVVTPPAAGEPHPGLLQSLPSTPAHAEALLATVPPAVPNATTATGIPDHAATTLPATEPRIGGVAQGVPQAYAAALPFAATSPAAGTLPASVPYCFLGDAATAGPRAAPADAPDTGAARSQQASADDRVLAQSFGLPGAKALRALLAEPAPDAAVAAPPPSTAPEAPYYFVATPDRAFQHDHARGVPALDAGLRPPFDVHAVRRDFPILAQRVNGRPLIWFDNAATTQKPQAVIDRLADFYRRENSNVHRAAHELAARATDAYEKARSTVARFIGADSSDEIVFVRGTTEAINLVAQGWGRRHVGAGDEIVVSHLEHHANIVPWQQLVQEKGAKLRVIPVDDSGQVLLEEYQRLLNDRTKIVAVTQVSNALGTVVPVREIVDLAHRAGALALIDGAQSVSHFRVDVQALDADFFAFSGHKIFGPTGIGVLYGKRAVLEDTPPWQGGGNMIDDVTFERTTYQPPPARFEAGTGNIADAAGLGAALEYLERVGVENVARYEHELLEYATQQLRTVPGIRLIGTARDKASVQSFVLAGYTPEEVGKALNQDGIAVRAGHHCAQPILRRYGLEATVRPSLAFYNTCEEVDVLIAALRRLAAARR